MTTYFCDFTTKDIKHFSKKIFKDIDLLNEGIAIDLITVVFKKKIMTIWDYTLDGKCKEGHFMMPKSEKEFLKKLMYHCGRQKVESQLKNNIGITACL